jgi:hypothetical protein
MIKIEVTGNSIPEVADKLLSLGAKLRYKSNIVEMANAAAVDMRAEYEAAKAEVAKVATVDPTPAPKSAPVAEVSESQPTTTEPSSTPVPVDLVSEDEELEVVDLPVADTPTIDVETDIRPLILEVVTKRGKPFMEDILSSFGVVKASHLEPALLPKLIDRCNEALGQ